MCAKAKFLLSFIAFFCWILPQALTAQEKYPVKPIKIVVALGPGSVADAVARILSESLRQELNTEVTVEHKPGAAGVVGADFVARSKADGYTLGLFHSSPLTTSAALTPNMPYDPIRDFTPLGNVGVNPIALAANAGAPWKTLAEFLNYARANPGKATCGIIGVGSHSHFNLELLKIAARVEVTTVPYKAGTGPAIAALLGGHIDTTSLVWPAVSEHVKAGKFRALAVTSRIKESPELPTFAALGFPQVNLEVFFALFGPAGLPKPVAGKLIPALEKTVREPAQVAKFDKMGFAVAYEGPKELSERIGKELTVVRDVARRAGIKQQ